MLKGLFVLLTSIFILNFNLNAQWEHANGGKQLPDATGIKAVIAFGDTIVTATSKGIYFSTNNGDAWTQKNTGLDEPTKIITLNHNGNYVFAGTENGVYVSNDNCDSWSSVSNDLKSDWVYSFVVKGNNVFAGTSSGFYLSSNNGNSWSPKNQGLNNDDPTVNALSIQGSTIFAGTAAGVYASTNNGDSWNNKNFTNEITRLYVAKSAIFISGEGYHSGVYVSTDNGANWRANNNGLDTSHDLHYSFISVGDSVYAGGSNSGVYLTTNNGGTWIPANDGLSAYAQANELTFAYNYKYVFVGSNGETGFCTLWRLPRIVTAVNDLIDNQDEIVKVYPNPANDQINVTLELPNDGTVSLSVFNELGNKIYSMPGEMKFGGTNKFTIPTASFHEGILYLCLRTSHGFVVKKFAVIK
jgi:photosystem II stability/assembly factor-like uncharacterized protein